MIFFYILLQNLGQYGNSVLNKVKYFIKGRKSCIKHIPLHDTVESEDTQGYPIHALIRAYSGKSLIEDSLFVKYKIKTASTFSTAILKSQGSNKFKNYIPPLSNSAEMCYYIQAADKSGRHENHPYIGAPDAHVFYAKEGITSLTHTIASNLLISLQVYSSIASTKVTVKYNLKSVEPDASGYIINSQGKCLYQWTINQKQETITWNGTNQSNQKIPSGIYFCMIKNGSLTQSSLIRLVK